MTRGSLDIRAIPVSETELCARLGPLSERWAEELEFCREGVLSSAVGRYAATRVPVTDNDGVSVTLGGHRIDSSALARSLRCADSALLLAVTLGAEVDRYLLRLSKLSVARCAIADGYASALAEALIDEAERRLSDGLDTTHRFSPGYGDLPLAEQSWLLGVLDAARSVGISLGEGLLMTPMKSISAIIGVKRK